MLQHICIFVGFCLTFFAFTAFELPVISPVGKVELPFRSKSPMIDKVTYPIGPIVVFGLAEPFPVGLLKDVFCVWLDQGGGLSGRLAACLD